MEDDLALLKDVDWIIEVVVERLDIKQKVFEKIETVLTPGTIISSNTSGIPAKDMCEGRSENFQKYFAITHFFNPPRYMKLLEIVPGPDTLPEVVETLAEVCERKVGKGIVYAKDTPNFVANRVGTFSMFSAINAMMELGLSIEAVDKLTGPVVGFAKSATFRTEIWLGWTPSYTWPTMFTKVPLTMKSGIFFKRLSSSRRCLKKACWVKKPNRAFTKRARTPTGSA